MEASSRGGTELGPRVGDQKSVSHWKTLEIRKEGRKVCTLAIQVIGPQCPFQELKFSASRASSDRGVKPSRQVIQSSNHPISAKWIQGQTTFSAWQSGPRRRQSSQSCWQGSRMNVAHVAHTHGTPDLHVAHMANVVAHVADVALTLQNRQLAASLCSGRCSDRWFWACWSSTQESCAHQRTPIHSYSCASLHIHLCALGFRAEAKTNSSASSTSFPPRCKLLSAPKRDKTIIDVASPKRETVQWVRWLQSFYPILSLRPCTANCNTCDVDLSARVERAVA